MYSLLVSGFMAKQSMGFQVYDDRVISQRCEVDAVLIFQ